MKLKHLACLLALLSTDTLAQQYVFRQKSSVELPEVLEEESEGGGSGNVIAYNTAVSGWPVHIAFSQTGVELASSHGQYEWTDLQSTDRQTISATGIDTSAFEHYVPNQFGVPVFTGTGSVDQASVHEGLLTLVIEPGFALSRYFGANIATGIRAAQLTNADWILAGWNQVEPGGLSYPVMARLQPETAMLWAMQATSANWQFLDVTSDGASGYFGLLKDPEDSNTRVLARFDSSGQSIWQRSYTFSGIHITSISLLGSDVLVSGNYGSGSRANHLFKFDGTDGSFLWGAAAPFGRGVTKVGANGQVIVAGSTPSDPSVWNVLTLNSNGAVLSSHAIDWLGTEYVRAATIGSDGRIAIASIDQFVVFDPSQSADGNFGEFQIAEQPVSLGSRSASENPFSGLSFQALETWSDGMVNPPPAVEWATSNASPCCDFQE